MKRFALSRSRGLLLGLSLSLPLAAPAPVLAGSLSDPVVEQDVIAADAAASSAPGAGLILVLAAVMLYVSTD